MTAQQQAERDGIDLEAANKRLAAMGMQQTGQQAGTPMTIEQQKAQIAPHTDSPAAAPKPARAKAVKGLCYCGKHWSRHRIESGTAFCYPVDNSAVFAVAPVPTPAPAPPAAPAPAVPGALTGHLTDEQAEQIMVLVVTLGSARAYVERSQLELENYLRSLTAK